MKTILITLLLVLTSSLLCSAEGLTVGSESVLLADGPGLGVQAEPSTTCLNGVYLVVWRECWHGEGGASRIYATRVDKDGKVLDPKGIVVAADAAGVQDRPRVAAGKDGFLVVWQELTGGKQYDVRAARISADGKVLDAKSIAVAAGPESESMPGVASDGQNYVVVYQGATVSDNDTVIDKYATAVSAGGVVGTPLKLFQGNLANIAWDGKSYLVLAAPYAEKLDASGQLVDKKKNKYGIMTGIHAGGLTCSLAGGNGGWLLINDRSQPDYWGWGGPGAMRCRPIGADGKMDATILQESSGVQTKQPNWLDLGNEKKDGSPWPYGGNAVAWDGKQYVAVWQRFHIEKAVMFTNCDLIASRVEGWKPLDDAGVPVANADVDEKNPALASDGKGGLLCAYEKYEKDGSTHICVRPITSQ
jgi:hypothetical protein